MKILIVTETIAGKGHEKAAKALEKAITSCDSSHEVKVVSLLEVFSKSVERLLKNSYMSMIRQTPNIWGWMYNKEHNFSLIFKDIIANVMLIKLNTYIKEEQPDIVVATHASCLGSLSKLKDRYNFSLAVVFTDFQINSFWIYKNIDYYFVPHEDFKSRLLLKNIDQNRIYITGIPIDPVFSKKTKDDSQLPAATFNILIMGGGLGLGGIEEVIKSLAKINDIPIAVEIVTGTNQRLFDELLILRERINIPLTIHQYIDTVHPLMTKAHLLISKPGGLTVSEALSIQTPIIVYKPLPGQEEQNVKFLIKNKTAIKVTELKYINYWVTYLYHHPKFYNKLRAREKFIAKPNSSHAISEILLKR